MPHHTNLAIRHCVRDLRRRSTDTLPTLIMIPSSGCDSYELKPMSRVASGLLSSANANNPSHTTCLGSRLL
jgi:hypothetical protein